MRSSDRQLTAVFVLVAGLWPVAASAAELVRLEAALNAKLAERRRRAVALAALCEAAGDFERAVAHYEMARRIRDDDFSVLVRLLPHYRKPSDLRKRLSVYQALARLQPHGAAWIRGLGSCYLQLGQRAQAEAVWRKLVEINPSRPQGLRYLAQTYREHDLLAKAVPLYKEALALAPHDRAIRIEAAEALAAAGESLAALHALARFDAAALTSHARRAEAVRRRAFQGLALPAPTRKVLEEALAAKPRSLADLAWAVAAQCEANGDRQAAGRFYRRVAAEEPDSARGKAAARKARQLSPRP